MTMPVIRVSLALVGMQLVIVGEVVREEPTVVDVDTTRIRAKRWKFLLQTTILNLQMQNSTSKILSRKLLLQDPLLATTLLTALPPMVRTNPTSTVGKIESLVSQQSQSRLLLATTRPLHSSIIFRARSRTGPRKVLIGLEVVNSGVESVRRT